MSSDVDNVRNGEKFYQHFEEIKCMSLVIQDHGKTNLPVNHRRIAQLHEGLWNSVLILKNTKTSMFYIGQI